MPRLLVNLDVFDIERAVAFYRDGLGLRVGRRFDAGFVELLGGDVPIYLLAKYANRHGLVSGATGTGKTVSLMVVAEGLSRIGVPVFIADVKGDVSGIADPGDPAADASERDDGSAPGTLAV